MRACVRLAGARLQRGLVLAWALLQMWPAAACSPSLVPHDAERRGGEGLRTVVVGEVISIRSLGRVDALREHRAQVHGSPGLRTAANVITCSR